MKTQKRIEKIYEAAERVIEIASAEKFKAVLECENEGDDKMPGVAVADIGTDHGYLAELLSKSEKVSSVIATDISKKSLSKLEKLINQRSLQKIMTVVGDGLKPIESVDVTVIAGIGGMQTIKMLKEQNKLCAGGVKSRYFVLQPGKSVVSLRQYLYSNHIKILSDTVVHDADQFYPIITIDVLTYSKERATIKNLYLGKNSLKSLDYRAFLDEMCIKLAFLNSIEKDKIYADSNLMTKYKLKNIIDKLKKI